MKVLWYARFAVFSAILFLSWQAAAAQTFVEVRSFEYTEQGVPVLIENLPGPESARNNAVFAASVAEIEAVVGKRPVLDLIELGGGNEAAVAKYEQGTLLLVEYRTPQASVEADARFTARLAELQGEPPIHYRRIGNYSAFVFDAPSEAAAGELLDQIKYQKVVQWLGEDPYLYEKAERFFAIRTAEIFLSTMIWVMLAAGTALFFGVISGLVFYRVREQRKATMSAFSDAGGMVRLNLDELSESEGR